MRGGENENPEFGKNAMGGEKGRGMCEIKRGGQREGYRYKYG